MMVWQMEDWNPRDVTDLRLSVATAAISCEAPNEQKYGQYSDVSSKRQPLLPGLFHQLSSNNVPVVTKSVNLPEKSHERGFKL